MLHIYKVDYKYSRKSPKRNDHFVNCSLQMCVSYVLYTQQTQITEKI